MGLVRFYSGIIWLGGKSYIIYMTTDETVLNSICVGLKHRKATGIHFGEDEKPYSNNGLVPKAQIDGVISMDDAQPEGYPFTALSNANLLSGKLPFFLYQGFINCLK